ncbi:MAG: DUF4417 domain-containing protein [Eubacterium sp.]|nr:DUF4417 domain-containing protein [Eubacterium sp.]
MKSIDLKDIQLIACTDVSEKDTNNLHKGIHHFVDDVRFEALYNKPEKCIDKYRKYRFVLTPDFSLYSEMDLWRQIESVGKNRWVGAYWQGKGLNVIPTISWSNASSFSFCFDGVEKHSVVAIGMIGCKRSRVAFMKGYNAMLERIEPEAIICLGNPFPEMEGNIIKVDYISSRRVVRYGW